MNYRDYQHNEKSFCSLTGLSATHFAALLPYFEEVHNEYFSKYDMMGSSAIISEDSLSTKTVRFLRLKTGCFSYWNGIWIYILFISTSAPMEL